MIYVLTILAVIFPLDDQGGGIAVVYRDPETYQTLAQCKQASEGVKHNLSLDPHFKSIPLDRVQTICAPK